MTSALAKTQQEGMVWTPEQRDLVKRTVAKDATDDELAMFLHVAATTGLDPLQKQIHFTKMGGRIAFIADVNGLQARAAREADYEGIDHAVVYEKDDFLFDQKAGEVLKHVNNPFLKGDPVGAWAIVHRKGMRPFVSCVRFAEYNNPSNALWKSKPAVMVAKCAKSTALRLAYPEQLGRTYDEAELWKEEEVALNQAPAVAQASALKEQLRSQVKPAKPPKMAIVDVADGETEEQATARQAAASSPALAKVTTFEKAKPVEPAPASEKPKEPAGPSIYEQMEIAFNEYGVPLKGLRPMLKVLCPHATTRVDLTPADLVLVRKALAEAKAAKDLAEARLNNPAPAKEREPGSDDDIPF